MAKQYPILGKEMSDTSHQKNCDFKNLSLVTHTNKTA